jgi:hypothetical protein
MGAISQHPSSYRRSPLAVRRSRGSDFGYTQGLDSHAINRLVGSRVVDASRFRTFFNWHPPIGRARALELTYGVPQREPG